jgi:hypothetical protein
MDRAFAVFTIVALVLACNLLMFKQSKGRMWSPLWMAFSASAAAGLNLAAGLIGYTLVPLLLITLGCAAAPPKRAELA